MYRELRVKEGFGVIIRDLVLYLTEVKDINNQKELCKKVHEAERQVLQENVDLHYMLKFGTNGVTSTFMDLVYGSISVTIKTFLFSFMPAIIFEVPRVVTVAISSLVKSSLYYLDLFKDILVAILIYQKVMTSSNGFILFGRWSLPTQMFLVFVCSLAATKICDLLTLVMHPVFAKWNRTKKFLATTLLPLLPAFIHVEDVLHAHKVAKMAESIEMRQVAKDNINWECHQEKSLSKENERMDVWHNLLSQFHANKNSVQDFVQLTALTIIILSSNTRSELREGFYKIFLDDDPHIIYISAGLSFFSLLRGPIDFISSVKKGFLGMKAHLLLIPYFAIGSATRVFMAVLLFTPAMGLWDTMHLFTKVHMITKELDFD